MKKSKGDEVRESPPRAKTEVQAGRVPRLRFPDHSGNWKLEKMEPYLEEYNERVPANTKLPVYSSTREGLVSQKDYFNGDEVLNDGEYGVVPHGYFVYRHMSDDGMFKFNVNNLESSIAVSKEYPVFRTVRLSTYFLLCMLNESVGFKRFAFKQKKGGTRTRLYFSTLSQWMTLIPSFPEQQKIAAFLSSLDDLIAAHNRKLEALKKYKKGLMQLLFPVERETVSKLRFPEYGKAGKWEWREAGTLFANRIESGEAGLSLYSVTMNDGLVKRSSLDRDFYDIVDPSGNKKVHRNDIAYNMMRMWQGALGVAPEDCMVSPAYVILNPTDDVCSDFYAYVLKQPVFLQELLSHSQGLTLDRLRLYYVDFAKIILPFPGYEEQQEIASTLSSLDNLIAIQAAKIEALKEHKRGLIQGLFPAPEEAL